MAVEGQEKLEGVDIKHFDRGVQQRNGEQLPDRHHMSIRIPQCQPLTLPFSDLTRQPTLPSGEHTTAKTSSAIRSVRVCTSVSCRVLCRTSPKARTDVLFRGAAGLVHCA